MAPTPDDGEELDASLPVPGDGEELDSSKMAPTPADFGNNKRHPSRCFNSMELNLYDAK